GRRANEGDAGGLAGIGQLGRLGEKAVARVERVAARAPCCVEQPLWIEIALSGRGRADLHGLVGGRDVERSPIRLGVNGDAADPQVAEGAGDAHGDLAPVGDENLLEGTHGEVGSAAQEDDAVVVAWLPAVRAGQASRRRGFVYTAAPMEPPATERVWSVAQLARHLRLTLEGMDGVAWVEGEIGGLKRAPSGHCYFTLKDEKVDACI